MDAVNLEAPEINQGAVVNVGEVSKLDYRIDKLEDDNYVTWKWQIMNVFKAKNLYEAVNSQHVDEVSSRQALALLGSALSRVNMALVVGCDTAFEAWQRLEIVFENKTTFEKQELLGKLHSLTGLTLLNYLRR